MDQVVQGEPTARVNYREQPGCHNCRHAHFDQWPDGGVLYCALGSAPPAFTYEPGCFNAEVLAWNEWADSREVRPFGICDAHEVNFGSIHFDILVQQPSDEVKT